MSTIGSGVSTPSVNPFALKEKGKTQEFQQKVDNSLTSNTLTKESYKNLKDSMVNGRTTLDSMLKSVGVPEDDIKSAFAKGKKGNITLTESQKTDLKALLGGAEDSKASPILKALKGVNMNDLNNEGDSMSRSLSLGVQVGVKISASDSGDPATKAALTVLGIDAEAHAGASIDGAIKVEGKVKSDGKIELSFETKLSGGLSAGASVSALGAEYGGDLGGEGGVKLQTTYTFNSKADAEKFLKTTGLGFKESTTDSVGPNEFKKEVEKTPYLSTSSSLKATVFVDRSSGTGKGLSHQTLTSSTLHSPGKKEQEWGLETQKGGITRLIGLEVPKSSVKLNLNTDTTVTPTTPAGNKNGSVSMTLNLDKIRGTGANKEKVTDKMTERLVSIMSNANKETGNLFDTTKARDSVRQGIEKLFSHAQDSLVAKGTPLKSITFDVVIAEVEAKYGSMLTMNFNLTPTTDGRKLAPNQPTTVSLNTQSGIKGSFGLTEDSSPVSASISAGYETETVKRLS